MYGYIFNVLLFLSIDLVGTSLLSRMKNPNEYVAPDDVFGLADLDENTYKSLLEQLPQLKEMVRSGKTSLVRNINEDSPLDIIEESDYGGGLNGGDDEESIHREMEDNFRDNSTSTTRPPFSTHWPQINDYNSTNLNSSLRKFLFPFIYSNLAVFVPGWPYVGTLIAKCYWCGLNTTGIPLSPMCHDVFDSGDFRARVLKRFFRAWCYQKIVSRPFYHWPYAARKRIRKDDSIISTLYGAADFMYSDGLITQYYGDFYGGCFKRFLDVGSVYTMRGCRSWHPYKAWHVWQHTDHKRGQNFAAHRYKRLEMILKKKNDYCIVSPHASLTPFARGISLYVRYHVCVCSGKYCNGSPTNTPMYSYYFLVFICTWYKM